MKTKDFNLDKVKAESIICGNLFEWIQGISEMHDYDIKTKKESKLDLSQINCNYKNCMTDENTQKLLNIMAGLDMINKVDLTELKSYNNPPE